MTDKELTREEIEKIIQEELLTCGFFDRLKARGKGNLSGLKALGNNIKQGANQLSTGKFDASKFQNSPLMRGGTTALSRLDQYDKQFFKLLNDMKTDLQSLFGPDYKKYPELLDSLTKINNVSEVFTKSLQDIKNDIQNVMNGNSNNTNNNVNPTNDTVPPMEPNTDVNPATDKTAAIKRPSKADAGPEKTSSLRTPKPGSNDTDIKTPKPGSSTPAQQRIQAKNFINQRKKIAHNYKTDRITP